MLIKISSLFQAIWQQQNTYINDDQDVWHHNEYPRYDELNSLENIHDLVWFRPVLMKLISIDYVSIAIKIFSNHYSLKF